MAIENNKTVLAVAREDAKVGRIVFGMESLKNFTFKRYKNSLAEVVDFIEM